jgi:hypothetical protein
VACEAAHGHYDVDTEACAAADEGTNGALVQRAHFGYRAKASPIDTLATTKAAGLLSAKKP